MVTTKRSRTSDIASASSIKSVKVDDAVQSEKNDFLAKYSLDDMQRLAYKLVELGVVEPAQIEGYVEDDVSKESDRVLCTYDADVEWTTYNIKNEKFTFPDFMKNPVYLAKGGFGTVVRCFRYGEPVAVKKVEVPDEDDWEMALRLLRELVIMKQAKKLKQRSICRIIDIFGDPNVECAEDLTDIFIVMPLYMPGALDTVAVSTPAMFKIVAGHTLSALHFLHNHKIMHRDIKKENIFFDAKQNRAYLADLGQARTWQAATMSGSKEVGTSCYLSPEIVQGRKYEYRSDVYSLGVSWYEVLCLTGKASLFPFGKSGGQQHIRMQRSLDPINTQKRKPGSKDPSDRFATRKWAALHAKSVDWKEEALVHIIEQCLMFDPKNRANTAQLFEIPYFFPFITEDPKMDLREVETDDYEEIKQRIFDLQHGSCRRNLSMKGSRNSKFEKMCSLAVEYFDNGESESAEDSGVDSSEGIIKKKGRCKHAESDSDEEVKSKGEKKRKRMATVEEESGSEESGSEESGSEESGSEESGSEASGSEESGSEESGSEESGSEESGSEESEGEEAGSKESKHDTIFSDASKISNLLSEAYSLSAKLTASSKFDTQLSESGTKHSERSKSGKKKNKKQKRNSSVADESASGKSRGETLQNGVAFTEVSKSGKSSEASNSRANFSQIARSGTKFTGAKTREEISEDSRRGRKQTTHESLLSGVSGKGTILSEASHGGVASNTGTKLSASSRSDMNSGASKAGTILSQLSKSSKNRRRRQNKIDRRKAKMVRKASHSGTKLSEASNKVSEASVSYRLSEGSNSGIKHSEGSSSGAKLSEVSVSYKLSEASNSGNKPSEASRCGIKTSEASEKAGTNVSDASKCIKKTKSFATINEDSEEDADSAKGAKEGKASKNGHKATEASKNGHKASEASSGSDDDVTMEE